MKSSSGAHFVRRAGRTVQTRAGVVLRLQNGGVAHGDLSGGFQDGIDQPVLRELVYPRSKRPVLPVLPEPRGVQQDDPGKIVPTLAFAQDRRSGFQFPTLFESPGCTHLK